IVYMTGLTGGTIQVGPASVPDWDTRYGITAKFVEAYMSFAKNSVLFFNVCFSAKTDIPQGAGAFIFACQKKGAGVYLGWTALLNANPAFTSVRYFVDRMVGELDGTSPYQPESPLQRPFPYDDILADMKKKGLGIDSASGAQLVAKPNAAVSQPILL